MRASRCLILGLSCLASALAFPSDNVWKPVERILKLFQMKFSFSIADEDGLLFLYEKGVTFNQSYDIIR